MTPPTLRAYQNDLMGRTRASLRLHRRTLVQAPTGSGKSVLIAYMIARAAEGDTTCTLMCHRKELLDQLSGTLWEAGVTHGRTAAGSTQTKDAVQVASVQTLVRRIGKLPPPKMLAIDEAHHASAATYRKIIDWAKDSWIIGLTATPCRTDGRGLDDLFNDLVIGPAVADLIEQGYLAPYVIYKAGSDLDLTGIRTRAGDWAKDELEDLVDQKGIVGDAVDHYRRLVAPGTCLVYCVSRAHARHVEAAYRQSGIDARYCAGDTPKAEREAIVRGLRNGAAPVVVSVELFGEGLDAPGLNAVQLLRPTQSLILYLQQIGRAMRPERGKERAIILDHVGNYKRHGLPDDVRKWSLKGSRKKADNDESAPALRHCEQCFAIYRAILRACPLCGWEPQREVKMPDEADGELTELDIEKHRAMIQRTRERGAARGIEALVELALKKGHKKGWAAHVHHARTKVPLDQCRAEENEIRRGL